MSFGQLTAKKILEQLRQHQTDKDKEKNARFVSNESKVLGVRHKTIFDLAKASLAMPLSEVEALLESPYYEARMAAASILDFKAQDKAIQMKERKELFELYFRRHDRINNWDFVDRSAKRVVGGYLFEADESRDILDKLARSNDPCERRTAIVATSYFIGKGELDDTFRVAELLVEDEHGLVQKAVGGWIREAGKKDEERLLAFLDRLAAQMPRPMLRNAIQKLPKSKQKDYLDK